MWFRSCRLLRLQHLGDRSFDYSVPPELNERVTVGSVVEAPFGRRMARAIVVGVEPSQEDGPATLKAIEAVLDDSVSPELLELARALSERYLSSFESCLRLVAPPTSGRRPGAAPARVRCNWVVPIIDGAPAAPPDGMPVVKLTAKQSHVLECLPGEGRALSELCALAGVGPAVVKALAAKGLVELTRPPEEAAGAERGMSAVGGSL